jgi:hypothetical protein
MSTSAKATSKQSLQVAPLRFGIAHTSLGQTAVTYDILHRDIAVAPLGLRIKLGEWGGGLFVDKRIGSGRFDAGPQLNMSAGSGKTFVGVGYEMRSRAVVGMAGVRF